MKEREFQEVPNIKYLRDVLVLRHQTRTRFPGAKGHPSGQSAILQPQQTGFSQQSEHSLESLGKNPDGQDLDFNLAKSESEKPAETSQLTYGILTFTSQALAPP